jgi:hypothetical protein
MDQQQIGRVSPFTKQASLDQSAPLELRKHLMDSVLEMTTENSFVGIPNMTFYRFLLNLFL